MLPTHHELEPVNRRARLLKLLVEDGGEEVEDEARAETHDLHLASSIEFIVDQERRQVIANKRDGRVQKRVLPGGKDCST